MRYIESAKAVRPIGPYSQGIVSNGMVFVSGMVGMDAATGSMVAGGIREQTAKALENVKAVLEEGGSSPQKVLRVTVYLKDGSHFKEMNEVYSSFFGSHRPTRSTVVVGFVKDGILVEIDCVASL
jgi:2-iminobutanoate/2-iminopropanoate deaminase